MTSTAAAFNILNEPAKQDEIKNKKELKKDFDAPKQDSKFEHWQGGLETFSFVDDDSLYNNYDYPQEIKDDECMKGEWNHGLESDGCQL
jgi:hypothetical protein